MHLGRISTAAYMLKNTGLCYPHFLNTSTLPRAVYREAIQDLGWT